MAYTRTNWENGKTPLKQNLQKIDDELETLDQNKADKSELANINLTNYYNKTEVDNKVANIPVVDTSNLETKKHITFKDWLPSTQYYKGDLIQGITMQDGGHNIWCLAVQDFVSSSINLDQDIFVYNVFAFMFYDANQDDGIGSGGVNIFQLEQRLALKADYDWVNNISNSLGIEHATSGSIISNLTTTDKSTLVKAINEINAKVGTTGQDGKSAYQVWLDAGHTGTINDFLISLKGVKGDKGDTGATGLKGDKGDTGTTGYSAYQYWLDSGNFGDIDVFLASLKGEKGDKGDIGLTGPAGTNGIDVTSPLVGIMGNLNTVAKDTMVNSMNEIYTSVLTGLNAIKNSLL